MSLVLHVPPARPTYRVATNTRLSPSVGISTTSTTASSTPSVPAAALSPVFPYGQHVPARIPSTPTPVRSSTMQPTCGSMVRSDAALHLGQMSHVLRHDSELRDVVDRVKHDLRDALTGGMRGNEFGIGDRNDLSAPGMSGQAATRRSSSAIGGSLHISAFDAASVSPSRASFPSTGSVNLPMTSSFLRQSTGGAVEIGSPPLVLTPRGTLRSPSPPGPWSKRRAEPSPLPQGVEQSSPPFLGPYGSLQLPMFAPSGSRSSVGSTLAPMVGTSGKEPSPQQAKAQECRRGGLANAPLISSSSPIPLQNAHMDAPSRGDMEPFWMKTLDGWYANRDRSSSPGRNESYTQSLVEEHMQSSLDMDDATSATRDSIRNKVGSSTTSLLTRGSTTQSLAQSQCTFVVQSGSTCDLDAAMIGEPDGKEFHETLNIQTKRRDTGDATPDPSAQKGFRSELGSSRNARPYDAGKAATPPRARESFEVQQNSPYARSWSANCKRSSSSAVGCTVSQQSTPGRRTSLSKNQHSGSVTPVKQQSGALFSCHSAQSARAQSPRAQSPRTQSPRTRDRKGSVDRRSESTPRLPSPRTPLSPRALLKPQDPSLQLRLSMAMMAEEHDMAPGAADKWKVLQLFHETISRSEARIERIDRIACHSGFTQFIEGRNPEDFDLGFYAPVGPSQVVRLGEKGFCMDDFEDLPSLGVGIPVASHFGAVLQRACAPVSPIGINGERCLCVLLCKSLHGNPSRSRNGWTSSWREYCVTEPIQLLLGYVVWFHPLMGDPDGGRSTPMQDSLDERDQSRRRGSRKKRLDKETQMKEYAKVRDPLIKVALQGLDRVAYGTMRTVLLPTSSVEAESVVSLYLLGGGGTRVHRPPGVDPREALGGVVVQRIENQPLYKAYCALGKEEASKIGAPVRYREDVVWHGTRLKRMDGEGASLATKLQSIAENGFDPHRCMKGAAAEGGIWVSTSPLGSFGHGGDGLVAFVLCLVKTNFNEWVDANCARVLQRERVLPLYSLVHA